MTYWETPRLRIERLSAEHFDFFTACLADASLMEKTLFALSKEQIQDAFDWCLKHWEEHGFGQGIGFLKATGQPVGIYGLKYLDVDGLLYLDPGALTIQAFQRHGYAREALVAILTHGFDVLGFEKITTLPTTKNQVALELIEKAGFQFVRHVSRVAAGVRLSEVSLYELSREDWKKALSSLSSYPPT